MFWCCWWSCLKEGDHPQELWADTFEPPQWTDFSKLGERYVEQEYLYIYNLGYIGHIYGHYKYGIHAIYGTLGGNWHTYNIWYLERNCHHKNIPQANLCWEIAIIYNWMTVFSLHLDDAILFILVLLSLLKYTHALHFWRQQLLCQLICKWAVLQPANIQKCLFQISRNTYFKYSEILI